MLRLPHGRDKGAQARCKAPVASLGMEKA